MKLRQNINDLDTWFERFEIIETQTPSDLNLLIQTLTQALKSINPLKVVTTNNSKLSGIWLKYVDIYSSRGDFQTADLIFQNRYYHNILILMNWQNYISIGVK